MENEKDLNQDDRILNLFEGLDEATAELKPLTRGLGFKDRVSEGVYTMEIENTEEVGSDGGTLDIGHEEMGDGVLNIELEGDLHVKNTDSLQPILFHSGHDGLIKRSAKRSGESLFGAFIDVLLVFASSIFGVAFLTEFTKYKIDFERLIDFNFTEVAVLFIIFAALFLSYKIFTRVFFGKTLGEWSSRHQLGLLGQQRKSVYPLQVFIREVAVLFTGIFVLPLLSKALKKDLTFFLSGLETYIEHKK